MEAKKRRRTESSSQAVKVVKRTKSNQSEKDLEPKPSASRGNSSRQHLDKEELCDSEPKPVRRTSKDKKSVAKKSKNEDVQLKSKELLDCTRHEIALRAREVKPSVDKSLFRDPEVRDSRFTLPFTFYSRFESSIRYIFQSFY